MWNLRRLCSLAAICLAAGLAGCGGPMLSPQFVEAVQPMQYQPVGAGDDAVKLAVHVSGKGKPLIFLHGLGASSYTWHKIAPALAKTHRVIAIDLKGFGQSDKPLDGRYSVFDQARLVQDYIIRNDLREATLVGHSYGGGVALAVALNMMDAKQRHLSRLVLIDSIAYRQPIPFFFQVLRTPVLGQIGLSLIPPEVQMERALSLAYYEESKVTPETVNNYASALYSEGGRHALLSTIEALDPAQADELSRRYKELRLPTLVLWCHSDKIVPVRLGLRLASELPNARLEVMRRCGHIPHEEQPEDTARAIKTFTMG